VRRQTYSYLPSRRASPPLDWYLIRLLDDRHICANNLLQKGQETLFTGIYISGRECPGGTCLGNVGRGRSVRTSLSVRPSVCRNVSVSSTPIPLSGDVRCHAAHYTHYITAATRLITGHQGRRKTAINEISLRISYFVVVWILSNVGPNPRTHGLLCLKRWLFNVYSLWPKTRLSKKNSSSTVRLFDRVCDRCSSEITLSFSFAGFEKLVTSDFSSSKCRKLHLWHLCYMYRLVYTQKLLRAAR